MKLNKGTILQASVEYILSLRKDHDRLVHMQHKQQTLEEENRRMVKRIQVKNFSIFGAMEGFYW